MPAPYDYASTLGGATGIAPSVQAAITGQQQIEGNNNALASQALQLQLAQRQAQRQQQMQRDFVTLADNPTAAGYAHFMTLYPEAHDALAKAWDALDTAQRQGTLRTVSDVYARLQNGDSQGAVAELQAHMDANKAAGEDTSNYPALIDAIQKDPKQAAALAGYALAAAVPPAQFSEMFKTLDPASKEVQDQREYDWRVAQFGKDYADNWQKNVKDTKLVPVTQGGQVFPYGPGSVSGAAPQPKGGDLTAGALDPQAFFKDFVLPHEGGYSPSDANGAPVNFGINQSANPGVDVKSLTPDKAASIFASKYFAKSGAAKLPPALAAVHADTYYINPQRAQEFLKRSGGDPNKYLALRSAWMAHLVQSDPNRYGAYANSWNTRNHDLASYIGNLGEPVAISTPQEAQGLAPGTHYRTPDGREFIR